LTTLGDGERGQVLATFDWRLSVVNHSQRLSVQLCLRRDGRLGVMELVTPVRRRYLRALDFCCTRVSWANHLFINWRPFRHTHR